MVPLFQALTTSETLLHRVAAEPLSTFAHPWPQAKYAEQSYLAGAGDSTPERGLPAVPRREIPSKPLRRTALQAYADDIERQQPTPPVAPLVVDPVNCLANRWRLYWPPPDWSDKPS